MAYVRGLWLGLMLYLEGEVRSRGASWRGGKSPHHLTREDQAGKTGYLSSTLLLLSMCSSLSWRISSSVSILIVPGNKFDKLIVIINKELCTIKWSAGDNLHCPTFVKYSCSAPVYHICAKQNCSVHSIKFIFEILQVTPSNPIYMLRVYHTK